MTITIGGTYLSTRRVLQTDRKDDKERREGGKRKQNEVDNGVGTEQFGALDPKG